MTHDHNDIYSIVERLRILEEGLDKGQKSVNQLSATFKPKTVAVLTSPKDPKNPMAGKLVGSNESEENDKEPVEEAIATEDVLDKVKKSFAEYLSNVADEIKKDTDLKDKKLEDSDLKKKIKQDRDLVAKEAIPDSLEEAQLNVGDPIIVTAPNEYEDQTGEIVEFSPSGKFVVLKMYNGDEVSMHLSDVTYNEYADEQDVDDAWHDDEPMEIPVPEASIMPMESPVKTITNECGIWEVHGDEGRGFELRNQGRALKSKFKNLEEAEIALEMFAARRAVQQQQAEESADYIDEA